jgi:putative membrane protein
MRALSLSLVGLLLAPPAALAHGDQVHAVTSTWTFDPWIVAPLGLVGLAYGVGIICLSRRSSAPGKLIGWRAVAFASGWLALVGALLSPLHALGEKLFTFHMIEHEIVMAVAAPLLVLARPIAALLWAWPRRLRLALGAALTTAAIGAVWGWASRGRNATLLHGVAIWAWHAPALFDAAVTDVAMHRLQHLSFFATAVLFWWSVLRRGEGGLGAWHLFVTMLHTAVLGALMALAPRVLYAAQTASALQWGLTPLQDQQLAGVIMWVPAGTVYAGAALALTASLIRQSGEGHRKREAEHAH